MGEPVNAALKERIMAYLTTVSKAKSREIATALNENKGAVDAAIKELALEDKVEFLYLGTSYVRRKEG